MDAALVRGNACMASVKASNQMLLQPEPFVRCVFSESPDSHQCRHSWLRLLYLLAMQIPSAWLCEMTAPCWMWTGMCNMWQVFWDKVKQVVYQMTAAHKNAVKGRLLREQFI